MRKSATFDIDGYKEPFEVRELTVDEIIDLLQSSDSNQSIASLKEHGGKLLKAGTSMDLQKLRTMAPSEIKIVWEKFKEVNSVFLELSQQLAGEKLLGELKEAIIKDFSNSLADFSKAVT